MKDCKHEPDVMQNTMGSYIITKCLVCKQTIFKYAGSRWMTNGEYHTYITQTMNNNGVDNEV